ncbi:hypothetical protein RHSIM_Rhsim04G0245200 [Rhododendron simsii]|uniref:KEN domain-containing protein n=1 Tax=Rhododendron simsii TaxID=118357 RepID=A0A834LSE5_RHOSS|nr:hypothetical protein RHSIM_Rhsim04G0245200 [Rhododendron simsii]
MQREFQFQYTVNDPTIEVSSGQLPQRQPPIVIHRYDDVHRFNDVMDSSLSITHTNLLRSFYGHGNNPSYVLYEDYSETLEVYIQNLKTASGFFKRTVPNVAGNHSYVNPNIRKLLRYVLKFIKDLHDDNQCIRGGFDMKNIVMVGRERTPKFIGVDVIPLSSSSRYEDYRSVRKLIDEIYTGHQLPPELSSLVDALRTYRKNEVLIHTHASLWEPEERLNFLRNVVDRKGFLSMNQLTRFYNPALRSMQLAYIGNWRSRIASTSRFYQVLHDRRVRNAPYRDNNYSSLVRFLRNAAVHVSEKTQGGSYLQECDIDPVLTTMFPSALVELQRCLFDAKLTHFWPH